MTSKMPCGDEWKLHNKPKSISQSVKINGTQQKQLWGVFTAIKSYFRKQEKSRIDHLTLHPKELGREEQTKPKVIRRKEEIIKIRVEINEETKRKKERKKKSMKLRAGSLKRKTKLLMKYSPSP